MDELDVAQITELFRKVRAIKDPEHDLGDNLAERYLIDDLNKLFETTLEAEYERGYQDASDEVSEDSYDDYDMQDARDSGYEEGHADGVSDTKRKYNITDDED